MKLRLALEDKLMDVRLLDRLLAEGKITKEQVDAHLAKLDDDSNNLEKLSSDETSVTE